MKEKTQGETDKTARGEPTGLMGEWGWKAVRGPISSLARAESGVAYFVVLWQERMCTALRQGSDEQHVYECIGRLRSLQRLQCIQ